MTATKTTSRRRTTKPATKPAADIDLDDVSDATPVVNDTPAAPSTARKYFSHANCDHARSGEAGKAARATCRRNIRAWLAAEAEHLASDVDIAV